MSDRVPQIRVSNRHDVTLDAVCRTSTRRIMHVVLSNISAEGCCIAEGGHLLVAGKRIIVRPQSLEGLSGIVRWVKGGRAGIMFDRPLYGPVLDHLVRAQPPVLATVRWVNRRP